MRYGGVARQILGVEAQRDVAPFDVGIDVGPQGILLPGRRGRLEERAVGLVDVEAAKPLEPRVGDDRDGRVALHREGLAPVEFPLGHPAPLVVDADHRAHHLHLPLGIDQRQQLVDVAVGVPQREDRIAVALSHTRLARTLHKRIFAIDVVHKVGMDQCMVQSRVEDLSLVVRAALDADAPQVGIPARPGLRTDRVEGGVGRLFGLEVAPGILHRDVGDAHPHLQLFALCKVVVREPVAHIVTGQLTAVFRVDLVPSVVGGPLGLDARHRALLLPVARSARRFRDPQHEVDREDLLGVVAERTEELHPLDLRGIYTAHHRPRFVRQPLAQVQQQVTLAARKRIAFDRRAGRGRGFGPDAVLPEGHGIVARRGRFVAVRRAVFAVIDLQLTRRGHRQQRSHVGTPHAAQRPVGESREEPVVVLIGGGPPAGILVVAVLLGAHDVERHDRHHAVGGHGPGVRRPEVGRPDKGIDPVGRLLRPKGGAENGGAAVRSVRRSRITGSSFSS